MRSEMLSMILKFLGGGECHTAGLCGECKTWEGGKNRENQWIRERTGYCVSVFTAFRDNHIIVFMIVIIL